MDSAASPLSGSLTSKLTRRGGSGGGSAVSAGHSVGLLASNSRQRCVPLAVRPAVKSASVGLGLG